MTDEKNKSQKPEIQGTAGEPLEKPVTAAAPPLPLQSGGGGSRIEADVTLRKALGPEQTEALPLWIAIHNRTDAIGFEKYKNFLEKVFCEQGQKGEYFTSTAKYEAACKDPQSEMIQEREPCKPFRARFDRDLRDLSHVVHGVNAYELLKVATQIFLLLECGIVMHGERDAYGKHTNDGEEIPSDVWRLDYEPDDGLGTSWADTMQRLVNYLGTENRNYIRTIIENLYPNWDTEASCRRLQRRADCPCMLELIWNYWMEEGGLTQSLKAISLRFQNRRNPDKPNDPLGEMEITPLRPINNLLWGYIQDEQNSLSVPRRAYEYDHHYGLTLLGKAVPKLQSVDSRSKFIEAFHYLLNLCHRFIQEDADTTVNPDPFPVLNALKEVHLLLSEGAHNQYGDLPWTSRVEMLIQQYLLSLPEVLEFLRSRAMVAYPEGWMGPQDAMKRLQGWTDVSSIHFNNLATFGERLLLSIRYDTWLAINNPQQARGWVLYWQQEIQGYIHAYRAATGVDLSNPDRVDTTMPAILLRKRQMLQRRRVSGTRTA
ncbi:MAG: hypothetical protein GWN55_07830 [Phycisphaerae bacterium]|nr:hypothetical protein [Phycisphaerae bacterium]NIU25990.1 hypothetical protein [candidate division KSB1 bacterium]NIS54785.1 hypothetical protein [Phycisphaerae bacterium]NIV01216.1 hypothetical protein [Phycisphaerae bacterium]NIV71115.1 hypothetical protein [Phycisphaerae bacterium]